MVPVRLGAFWPPGPGDQARPRAAFRLEGPCQPRLSCLGSTRPRMLFDNCSGVAASAGASRRGRSPGGRSPSPSEPCSCSAQTACACPTAPAGWTGSARRWCPPATAARPPGSGASPPAGARGVIPRVRGLAGTVAPCSLHQYLLLESRFTASRGVRGLFDKAWDGRHPRHRLRAL